MIRVLVTAFGAFPGAPVNPTMAIAAGLRKRAHLLRLAGIDLVTAELPVVYATAEEMLAERLASVKPDAILHLGLAGRRKTISIETRARNRLSTIHPDASRALSGRMKLELHGTPQRRSRFPVSWLVAGMRRAGLAVQASADAGDYLCNQILYLSLASHDRPCGFIHVPRPRRPRSPPGAAPSPFRRPSLPELRAGVETAVRLMARCAAPRKNTA